MSHKYEHFIELQVMGLVQRYLKSALNVLEAINDNFSLPLEIKKLEAGDTVLKNTGKALPDETFEAIKNSDACLKGASR